MAISSLKSFLKYEPATGTFIWRRDVFPRTKRGQLAGNINSKGYVRIGFRGKSYQAHRLAWYFYYGNWPSQFIDHKNGNTADNRISNLKLASHRDNLHNCRKHRDGKLVGTSQIKSGKWKSVFTINKKQFYLGLFDSELSAHMAYKKEANKWKSEL